MNSQQVYLKQNVLAEPLFNQWYAWSYLISPATAAMYIANSHVKIMQSFVSTPQVHIAALKNPAMLGGPFINYDASKVPAIRTLLEKTTKEQAHMLEFAEAIKQLDETLKNEGTGYSLEPLYEKMPEVLRGYTELTYDLNNNPSVRFIEGLLYKSPYYCESRQSISLSLVERDERPFIFSTPRLIEKQHLQLNIPFSSESWDELFKMKHTPQPYEYIKEVLKVDEESEPLFSSLFTTDNGAGRNGKYHGDKLRIRYLGHACVLIETGDITVLTDPVISYEDNLQAPRYTYLDLPNSIDYVLITHNHQDHCMFETLLQLRHKVKTIVVPKGNGGTLPDPSLKLVLRNIGFKNVIEIDELEELEVEGGSILSLPFLGEHADLSIRTKTAFLIQLQGKSILCAADSNNIEPRLYELLYELVGDVDIAFLGMECDGAPMSWLYGPLSTRPLARKLDQSRRLDGSNYERGIDIINRMHPKEVYVYAMGQEPWLTYLTSIRYTEESRPIVESNRLVEDCCRRGIPSERLFCQKEIFL